MFIFNVAFINTVTSREFSKAAYPLKRKFQYECIVYKVEIQCSRHINGGGNNNNNNNNCNNSKKVCGLYSRSFKKKTKKTLEP